MRAIRRRVEEQEVEAPDDLLTLAEAHQEFGIEIWRLSAILDKGLMDAYVVPSANPRKGGRRVRRADLQEWMKPVILDGLEGNDDAGQ